MPQGIEAQGTILVSGASGAIGNATVRWFLNRGWAVLGVDRAPSTMTEPGYRHLVADLEDAAALSHALREALEAAPPLRHVVAIAGGALPGEPQTADEPWTVSTELFRASIEANLTTQFVTVQASLPALLASSDDRSIVLTSSFNAFTAQGMPAYSAAKAGLSGMMNGFVGPLGRRGVRVNVVAPGTVVTPRTERLWSHDQDDFERLAAISAMGRLARPDDVADSIGALASSMHHVTGQVLFVDGGQSLSLAPRG